MKLQHLFLICGFVLISISAGALGLLQPGELEDVAGVPGRRGYSGDGADAA